jgi:hypothetical protein
VAALQGKFESKQGVAMAYLTTGPGMRHAYMFLILLAVPAHAQTIPSWATSISTPPDAVSVRDCRRPAEAKEAQVLAFDKTTLEAKLAVSVGDNQFKVVTIRLWDRHDDPRPVAPVVEAARITQGKLQFYTPNLDADPEPVHDKQFLLIAGLGGAQICWATESSLLKEATSRGKASPAPEVAAPAAGRAAVSGNGTTRR